METKPTLKCTVCFDEINIEKGYKKIQDKLICSQECLISWLTTNEKLNEVGDRFYAPKKQGHFTYKPFSLSDEDL